MAACSGGVSPRRPRGSLSAPLGGAAGRGSRNGKRDLVARRKVFLPCSSLPSLVPGAGGAAGAGGREAENPGCPGGSPPEGEGLDPGPPSLAGFPRTAPDL